ncbi:MAG: lipoprotein-releasing ABC transporter ATP-binding protein LolD [Gammaproteobacteria bacterium]|nr:lipoprotein-releasing ABC transporter ATP-binding protein LolD [Gammaproteobacteria bacterium]
MSEQIPVIEANHLSKIYADGRLFVEVLRKLDLKIYAGEMVAVIGASGAGKSTLLHLLGGLDVPSSGSVLVNGRDINALPSKAQGLLRNQYLGFVYQFHHLLPEFDALENVSMPLLIRGLKPRNAEERAAHILEKVGLSQRIKHRVGELSGGERQRVAIARALVTEPKCILADEPTGNLDQKTAEPIFELMINLNKELKTSFIVVTHNLELAKKMQRTLVLEQGTVLG